MQSNGHMKSYAALVSWDILGLMYAVTAVSQTDTCSLMDTCSPIGYIRSYGHIQSHGLMKFHGHIQSQRVY